MAEQIRILVIDDNRPTMKVLSGILHKHGYDVYVAFNGVEGLAKAKQVHPHLIILDTMPCMDGYQICRQLQHDPQTVGIGVLVLTARRAMHIDECEELSLGQDMLQGLDPEAIDVLDKPVRAEDLIERVESLLCLAEMA